MIGSPGHSAAECVCLPGFYLPDPSRNQSWGTPPAGCVKCLEGAECPGGPHPPHPQRNFWADPNTPLQSLKFFGYAPRGHRRMDR
eukprot:5285337-Pyramimonas_sp.AAC.2